MAFESLATDLVDDHTSPFADLFVHNRRDGTTVRVNVRPDGSQADQGAGVTAMVSATADGRQGDDRSGEGRTIGMSCDGRFTPFHSLARNFAPDDRNVANDFFAFDRDAMVEASAIAYGTGTAGTLGVPAFSARAAPEHGTTLTSAIRSGVGRWPSWSPGRAAVRSRSPEARYWSIRSRCCCCCRSRREGAPSTSRSPATSSCTRCSSTRRSSRSTPARRKGCRCRRGSCS